VLKSFQQRLNGNLLDYEATQQSSLALLPQLLSILEQPANLALKKAALTSVDLVVDRFGKQDLPSAFAAAKIVLGTEILGSCDRSLQVAALLCLASMVEVLKDMFTPLVPSTFPNSLSYLRASITVGKEDHRLHNAAHCFIGALLSTNPWIFTDSYLEQLLSVSYESANSGMGKECDQARVDTLRVLARQVAPQPIFAALGRAWDIAMKNGPIVSELSY
jgi:U3 small nucleolar RNA-associated protein 10